MEEEEHQKRGKKANKGRKKNKKTPTIQGWCRCWKWWQAIVIPELINDINFIICSNCCKWRWRRLTVEKLVYKNEDEATQRAWIGCDRTGCWRWYHYWYAGFSRKPRRNTVYVKSAHLDTAAMQQYTYILKLLKYSLTIVLLIFTSIFLPIVHLFVSFHSHLSQPWLMTLLLPKFLWTTNNMRSNFRMVLPYLYYHLPPSLQHVCSAFLEIP